MKFILSILICIGIYSCKKNTDNQTNQVVHNFTGIVVTDDIGQHVGTWGKDDGDWDSDTNWSQEESALLNFPDTIDLAGTFVKDTSGWNIGPGIHEPPQNIVVVFPNPARDQQVLFYKGLGLLKFKVTVVDKYFNRLFSYACKDSIAHIELNLSDNNKFQNGTIYRLYYSLSATDRPDYYNGHGDILICRESGFQDCQKFVP